VKTLRERCSAIELLIVDVDGVLTTGGIAYGTPEVEIKAFHVRDGSGLHLWHRAGKRTGWITGRSSPIVERRAAAS
jgi:YrbI family 3-deoxy-D-manno-octulosonate 8-phosphate phosphatase